MADLTGITIKGYHLTACIGQGGMARVYKAFQPVLGRPVAVKVIRKELSHQPDFVARFSREARLIARLRHSNIVRIYDSGIYQIEEKSLPFLVMEFIEGPSLQEKLAQGARQGEYLSLENVLRWIAAIADAVDYAHAQGIVHRDLKPANILFAAEEQPVLTDFGLARLLSESSQTLPGAFIGTPVYMAPEQVIGRKAGQPSDIYALGVILFVMLTYHLPWESLSPSGSPPLSPPDSLPSPCTLRPDLPPEAEEVVLKAMAWNPQERYTTAGEMASALATALGDADPSHPEERPFELARRNSAARPAASAPLAPSPQSQETPSLPPDDPHPPSYRAKEAAAVMALVRAGESGSLIGFYGIGLSAFLRFLTRPEVRKHYLGPAWTDYTFLHIDFNALPQLSDWGVFGLMLRDLEQALASRSPARGEALAQDMRPLSHYSQDPWLIQEALCQAIEILCRQSNQRVVFLMDEFDVVFGHVSPSVFLNLRALRDAYRERVIYITATIHPLSDLRPDLKEVASFYWLVNRNATWVGPLQEADATGMLHFLAARRGVTLEKATVRQLVTASGGHATILKALFNTVCDGLLDPQRDLVSQLKDDLPVVAECWHLWSSLNPVEQQILQEVAIGRLACRAPLSLHYLHLKEMIRSTPTGTRIFSPLLAGFIRRFVSEPAQGLSPKVPASPSQQSLFVDEKTHQVWVEGRSVTNLTALEFKLLSYLWKHRGQIRTRGELAAHLYPKEYDGITGHIISEPRVDTLIARLRAKIEPDRNRLRYLLTFRRQGYKLVASNTD
jgi:serine/threonine protein kinase/DNA-binding winged helix-turn-helix (wHTH) protein